MKNNSTSTATMSDGNTVEDLFFAALVLTAVLGVIGNILVCIVLQRFPTPSPMDLFIKALAVADIGILLFIVPLILIRIRMNGEWPFGSVACHVAYPIQDVFYGASIWIIVIIAVERRRCIVKLARAVRRRSLKSARLIVFGIYVFNFVVFALPLYFMMDYARIDDEHAYCLVVWPKWSEMTGQTNLLLQAHSVLIVLIGYLIPLCVIVCTYVSISRHLKESTHFITETFSERSSTGTYAEQSRLRQNTRAKRLLTPVVAVFAVTMLPLNVLRLVVLYTRLPDQYFDVIFPLFCLLVTTNSLANPVIYNAKNRRFRLRLKALFSCVFKTNLSAPLRQRPDNNIMGIFSFRRSMNIAMRTFKH